MFRTSLNLYFQWELQEEWKLRLLRPYLSDGTPITTSMEEHHLRIEAEERRDAAEALATEEIQRRREAEAELERLRAQLANTQNNDL